MPTKKPRVTFTVSQDTLDRIDDYRDKSAAKNQTKAIVDLLEKGLRAYEGPFWKPMDTNPFRLNTAKREDLSPDAVKLALDYEGLDSWGKKAVRAVADIEMARCADEERFREEAAEPAQPRQIPLYLEPAAAGIPAPVAGRDYEIIDLGPDDPQGAAFAVRLQGDSMAPDFPDGCIVFVNHDSLADGDIGIFSVDTGTVCKQYHKDAFGMVYLFSLNRKRTDADIVIPPSSNQTLVCQGRVMTKKHYPIPGMW